ECLVPLEALSSGWSHPRTPPHLQTGALASGRSGKPSRDIGDNRAESVLLCSVAISPRSALLALERHLQRLVRESLARYSSQTSRMSGLQSRACSRSNQEFAIREIASRVSVATTVKHSAGEQFVSHVAALPGIIKRLSTAGVAA